ncbi:MAG: NAD-dependent epimerase/dehydratase family protein [Candidatus Omnitrophica bacterium]|nr:NAD-dependent epimerase/dehydratase family protein [Candidatus Omnitrophota bacterium]
MDNYVLSLSEEIKDCFKAKNVLITGGLGFIGSNLARALVELEACVWVVDSMIPEYGGNLFNLEGVKDKVHINFSDMRDRYSLDYLVKSKQMIFNLAGTLSHIDSMKDPFTDLQINCNSQLSLLEACKMNNPEAKIVFAGTRGQYGKPEYLPVDEKHPMCPIDVNGINNIAGEWYHILYNNVYGIKACSLRLTNTYGPRHQMRHPRQGVINWFVRKLLDQEAVKIYGDGTQVRDLNYVDDVVVALLLAMANEKTNGQIYNLGGEALSLVDLVKLMIKVFGRGSYESVPYNKQLSKIEIGDYQANTQKIAQDLGWQPQISLEEGFKRTFEYYQTNKQHYW